MIDCVTFALCRAGQILGREPAPDPRANVSLMAALSTGAPAEWLPGWRRVTEREQLANGDIVLMRTMGGGQHVGVFRDGAVEHFTRGHENRVEASRLRRFILGAWRCAN